MPGQTRTVSSKSPNPESRDVTRRRESGRVRELNSEVTEQDVEPGFVRRVITGFGVEVRSAERKREIFTALDQWEIAAHAGAMHVAIAKARFDREIFGRIVELDRS